MEGEMWRPGGEHGTATESSDQLYLVTLPEGADERQILDHIHSLGEDRLERVSWGRSGTRTYLILKARDESEAMNVVPPPLRQEAQITAMNNLGEAGAELESSWEKPGQSSKMELDPYGQGSTAAEPPSGGRPPGDGMTGGSGRSGKKTA